MALGELIVSIIGDMKELSSTISQVQKEIGEVGKTFTSLGSSLSSTGSAMTAAITVPIVGAGLAFAGVAKEGMEFEKGMAQVYTLIPDMSKEAFGKMSADTLQFAKDMKVPTEEVLPALYDAIGSGIPQDNVFSFLEVAQKGAVAGATNVGVAVDTLTSLINAYGAENLSAADASDILFAGINVGKMSYEELQKSLSQVIPTAASLQIPLEQVVGALAAMTAQGTPTAQSTTQLSRLFNELAKEGTSAYNTFKEISGKSFPQFIKEGGTVEDALKLMKDGFMENSPAAKELENRMRELVDPTSGLSLEFESLTGKTFKEFRKEGGDVSDAFKILGINTEEADGRLSDMFGSIEAGNAVLTLTSRDGAILTDVMDEMERSAGQTDEAFAKISDTTSYAFESMSADIKNATTEMGVRLLPIIQDTIVPLITDTLIPAFEGAVNVIGVVADAFNKLPQPVKVVILAVTAFIAALGPALVAIGAVVSSIGTLAAAFGTGGALAGAISFISATILPALSAAFGIIVYTVIPIVIEAIALLATPFGLVAAALAVFVLAWKNNWFDIQGKFQAAKTTIETAVRNFSNTLQQLWHGLIMAAGNLKTQFSAAWDAIKTSFSTLSGMIVEAVTGLYNRLVNAYNSIVTSLGNLKTNVVARWTEIKTGIQTKLNEIIADAQTWLSNQQAKFTAAITQLSDLKTQALARWVEIKAGILAKLNEIISDAQTWINNQLAKFNTVISNLVTFKTNAIARWTEIKAQILEKLNAIIADIQTWISNQLTKLNDTIATYTNFKSQAISKWNEIKTAIKDKLDAIVTDIKNHATSVGNAVQGIVDKIKDKVSDFKNAGKAIIEALKEGVEEKIDSVKKSINGLLTWIDDHMPHSPAEEGPLSRLPNFSSYITTPLKKSVAEATSTAKSAGSSIMSSIANGVKSAATTASNSISSAYKKLRSYMPFSPAEEGPFSEIPNWDTVFVDPLSKSIAAAGKLATPLSNALSSLRSPIDSSLSAGFSRISNISNSSTTYAGDTISIGPNTITNGIDLQAIIAEIERHTANKRRARGLYK